MGAFLNLLLMEDQKQLQRYAGKYTERGREVFLIK